MLTWTDDIWPEAAAYAALTDAASSDAASSGAASSGAAMTTPVAGSGDPMPQAAARAARQPAVAPPAPPAPPAPHASPAAEAAAGPPPGLAGPAPGLAPGSARVEHFDISKHSEECDQERARLQEDVKTLLTEVNKMKVRVARNYVEKRPPTWGSFETYKDGEEPGDHKSHLDSAPDDHKSHLESCTDSEASAWSHHDAASAHGSVATTEQSWTHETHAAAWQLDAATQKKFQ